QAPQLLPRLASVFYWQIIERGQPADVAKYQRLFGRPADDPNFHRMRSLVLEQMPDYSGAHVGWQEFLEDLAGDKATWREGEATRARAMVWFRMGLNAEKQDQIVASTKNLPPISFFREADKPARLRPSAADCFRNAAKLAPDWLDPHWQWFDMLRGMENNLDRALKAGSELLKRFPEHLPTLEAMADLERDYGHFDAAAAFLERAMHVNPLDRTVTTRLSDLYRQRGVTQFREGQFEEGRNSLQAALGLADSRQQFAVFCQWAAGEFRAGNLEQAEALLQKAAANEAERPALSAFLFAHCVLWKLPKAIKTRFEKPLQEQLKQASASPAEAVALASLFARYEREHVEYFGHKTHQKKILALIGKTVQSEYTELQMQHLGKYLLELKAIRLLRKFTSVWQRQFPKNPYSYLYEIESYLTGDSDRWPLWKLGPLLQKAKGLAEKLPPSEERDEMLKLIEGRQQQFHDLNPFASFFESIMDELDDEEFDDEDEDDDPW
ncbi:MAG TPA: hypothetical protein VKS79_18300, partial [Gemmataceae bacterium]|nr:hypothetical protein [Gemmataceae bacterium]